jgi:hypothetical protein
VTRGREERQSGSCCARRTIFASARCIPPRSGNVVRYWVTATQKVKCRAVFHLHGRPQGGYASAFHPSKGACWGPGFHSAKLAGDAGFARADSRAFLLAREAAGWPAEPVRSARCRDIGRWAERRKRDARDLSGKSENARRDSKSHERHNRIVHCTVTECPNPAALKTYAKPTPAPPDNSLQS